MKFRGFWFLPLDLQLLQLSLWKRSSLHGLISHLCRTPVGPSGAGLLLSFLPCSRVSPSARTRPAAPAHVLLASALLLLLSSFSRLLSEFYFIF